MRDATFQIELREALEAAKPEFTNKRISELLHITPAQLCKWKRGYNAPIWLAKVAALSIIRGLK